MYFPRVGSQELHLFQLVTYLLKDTQRLIEIYTLPLAPNIGSGTKTMLKNRYERAFWYQINYPINVKEVIHYLNIFAVMVLTVNLLGESVAGAAMAMFPGAEAPQSDVDAAHKANPRG